MKVSSELVATNTLWFVLFLTSLTTAQVHFLPQTLTWLFTSSQSLYNAPCFLTFSQRVADFWVSLFYCWVSDLAQKFHGDPHLQAALIVRSDRFPLRDVTSFSPCSVWRHCPVRMSHTRTVESAFPETRMLSRSSMPLVSDWWPVSVWTHPPEQETLV